MIPTNSDDTSPDRGRLGTTDAKGWRVYVQPADVRGLWVERRKIVQTILLLVFLILPWVIWNGEQLLLLDVANRKFNIFGLNLRAHNTPLLFLVLAAAGFGLFFVTSIWGRVWCGWACPQTVFIERVFRKIERWVEGAPLERRKLDQQGWTAQKFRKRGIKWFLFVLASLVITHSFLAYFVGSRELVEMISGDPRTNWASFLFILFSTGIILFDFGWFREQFCIIACPYGRFQSVLMDSHSLAVVYDAGRGEPRRGLAERQSGAATGDCVDCKRCVQVCPTGIDIRNGVQMECIACTACIDACDEVMTKVKKPVGLIRYDTVRGLAGKVVRPFRLRTVIYGTITLAAILTLGTLITTMARVDIQVFRAKETPYQMVKGDDGSDIVVNHFKVELSNQDRVDHIIGFRLDDEMTGQGSKLVTAFPEINLKPGDIKRADVFVQFPKTLLSQGQKRAELWIQDHLEAEPRRKEIDLVGPFN